MTGFEPARALPIAYLENEFEIVSTLERANRGYEWRRERQPIDDGDRHARAGAFTR